MALFNLLCLLVPPSPDIVGAIVGSAFGLVMLKLSKLYADPELKEGYLEYYELLPTVPLFGIFMGLYDWDFYFYMSGAYLFLAVTGLARIIYFREIKN